uniref:nitrilase-related carbon-nitrogen hydrolase n=1 Tax=Thaumasiovibrio occultus TaxID=1891184 RepID=UPI000B354EF6|nr:nitrilase-related carbon-nitrogen hydrolase [Thaumasiovibrio occultus]
MYNNPQLHVGIAQIAPELGKIDVNLHKHLQWIEEGHSRNLDVLVFPELSLTGYRLRTLVQDVAISLHDPIIDELAAAAGNMAVSFGFVEAVNLGEFANTVVTVKNGQIIHLHRKINLANYGENEEAKWFCNGSELDPFAVAQGWQSHVLISADLWNPALSHVAMLDKPSLLIAPICSTDDINTIAYSNSNCWKTNVEFLSMTYGVNMLLANTCGNDGNNQFWGGSRIMNAFGQCVAEAGYDEVMISAIVSTVDIAAARFQLPTLRDANSSLIAKLLQKHL